MMRIVLHVIYILIGVGTLVIDRITKQWALQLTADGIFVNQFLSFDLVFNRGVTAGMLQSESPLLFGVLSGLIAAIIVVLGVYTFYRHHRDYGIIGEVLTLSGAVSNLVDRYLFNGVVDFIHLSYGEYSFPIFNIADMCIVFGVAIIFIQSIREDS
jgi:signal peptidase II